MIYAYAQEALNGGELSPKMWGRVSSDRYKAGLALCENFIASPHGPVTRRGGTHYVAEVKDSSKKTWLIPYIMGNGTKVIFEFGDLYIRVYNNRAQVKMGSVPLEIVSTYTADEVSAISYAYDADCVYLAHPNHPPQKLTYTSVSIWVLSELSFTSAPSEWEAYNYPSLVFLFEQRLGFGRTPKEPHKWWLSKAGSKLDFTTGSEDDEAIYSSMVDGARLSWFSPGDKLLFGTSLYEGKIVPDTTLSPISPTNCYTRPQTFHGSAEVPPVRMDSDVLFFQRGTRKLRKLGYRLDKDAYSGDDLTLPSEHITTGGITSLAYVNEPDGILWASRTDGQLIGFTYEPNAGVSSWHRHIIGGEDAEVLCVAGIHGSEAYKDEVWMIVSRTIDGATVQYVEYLIPGLIDSEDIEDSFFVDSGVTIELATAATIVPGLDHLVGETVSVFTDGYVQPDAVVDEFGQIALQSAATKITCGLPYTSKLKTLPLEAGSRIGSAQGKIKRVTQLMFRLHRSLGLIVCDADEQYEEELYFGPATVHEAGVALFTGDTEPTAVPQGYTREGQIVVKQTYPLPLCISLIAYGGRTGD